MTTPADIEALVGAKLYISATIPDTYDATGYQSTDLVWTEIGVIENLGEHGGTKVSTPFKDVATGRVRKVGGSIDWGQMPLTIGNLYSDAGQALLKTAFANNNTHYSFKLQYDDGSATTDEIHFFDGIVTQFKYMGGTADDVRKVSTQIEICQAIVVVAPT